MRGCIFSNVTNRKFQSHVLIVKCILSSTVFDEKKKKKTTKLSDCNSIDEGWHFFYQSK